jgi:hypothetical protein
MAITLDGTTGITTPALDSQGVAVVNRQTTDGTIIDLRRDGTTVATIGVESSDNVYFSATTGGGSGLQFWGSGGTSPLITPMTEGVTSDAEVDLGRGVNRFRDLYLSGGIYLGGTAAANLLDDVETGTWTPVVSASTAGTSTTVTTGEYTRVGGIVCLTGALDWSDTTTSWAVNNYVTVGGFPFTALYGGNAVGYSNRSYPTTSSQFIGLTTASDCRLICVNADGSRHSDAIRFSLTIMV